MNWDFKEGRPIYTQIVDQMSLFIASGAVKPGERLPSVRDLAMEAGVNPNTMQRSLSELERQGLLHSERTSGRFVTDDEGVLKKLRSDLSMDYIKELFENLEKLGLTGDEIIWAVTDYAKHEKERKGE
ncbi:MAG: GntR family transcriptional regulator [Anaerovoracaceae bacterium]